MKNTKIYQIARRWFFRQSEALQVAMIDISITVFICGIAMLSLLIVK